MPRYLVSGIAQLVSDVAAVLGELGAEVVEVDDIDDVPRVCADAGPGAFDGYVQLPATFTVQGDTAVQRVHHFFAQGVLARFPAVYVLDSTTISLPDALAPVWPGCGGRVPQGSQAALKLTVRHDLVRGGLEGPTLSAGRDQDKAGSLPRAPMPAGARRLADLGFWSLEGLRQIAAAGSYFLSRLHRQTTVFIGGERVDLVAWLRAQDVPTLEVEVTLGRTAQLAARLLAVRLPQAQAERRRAKLRAALQREGQTPSADMLARAAWTLVVTNAPPALLSLDEAQVLARVRWQIELLFKRWKRSGGLARSRSANPDRVLCEIYAKLIALVLQHWVLLVSCWRFADRSLTRATTLVQDYGLALALVLDYPTRLRSTLHRIQRALATGCRIDKRRAHPSAFQLLEDPSRCYA